MTFELENVPGSHFQQLNSFFLNDSAHNQLVEQSQKINLPFADIFSSEWFFDDIRISYSDWHYKHPIDLKWKYHLKTDLITYQVNLKGSVFIGTRANHQQLFGNNQHNLFYSNAEEANTGFLRPADMRTSMLFIQFRKDPFLRLTSGANDALNHFGENIVNGRPALLSNLNLPVNASMLNAIKNIVNCPYKDGVKKMYLLSKSIELLVLQAEVCNTALVPSYKYLKTKYDQECIQCARDYVLKNLAKPPSLSELSKIIGINEYKLKRGFKEIFGNTVFGFLSDLRLEAAKNDLLASKKTIREIAFSLGYSSMQHFSNAFKKKFGMSPNKLRAS